MNFETDTQTLSSNYADTRSMINTRVGHVHLYSFSICSRETYVSHKILKFYSRTNKIIVRSIKIVLKM